MQNQLTQEEIDNFPVKHLSPSAIMCFSSDQQTFFERYVLNNRENIKGPSAFEGSVFHDILKSFRTDVSNQEPKDMEYYLEPKQFQKFIDNQLNNPENTFDFKKGSLEDSMKTIQKGCRVYFNELPDYSERLIAVEGYETFEIRDRNGFPLPVMGKGGTDLIVSDRINPKDIEIVDHKLVGTFTSQDKIAPHYIIQGCAYYYIFREKYGVNPKRARFDQVKASKNKDGSPQIVPYYVEFTNKNLCIFEEIYRRVVKQLAGRSVFDYTTGESIVVPNIYGAFNAHEGRDIFMKEIEIKYADEIAKDSINLDLAVDL